MKKKIFIGFGVIFILLACLIVYCSRYDRDTSQELNSEKQGVRLASRNSPEQSHAAARKVARSSAAAASSDSPVELRRDLYKRVHRFRTDIENSNNPADLVSAFLNDLAKLDDHMSRDHYALSFVNQLVRLEKEEPKKYDWIAKMYPKIEDALSIDANLTRPLKSTLFGVLYSWSSTVGADPYEEAMKIEDNDVREKFVDNLLPKMVTLNNYSYPDIMETLSPDRKRNVEQAIIEEAIRNKASRLYALDLYLDGRGREGLHEQEITKLMNDTAWYWKNSEKIHSSVEQAGAGDRRDAFVAEMVRVINRRYPEEARNWIPDISNKNLRATLAKEIEDK